MIRTATKWAAGAATPTADKNGSSSTYNRNRGSIVPTVLRTLAVMFCFVALGCIQREDFATGYLLAVLAGVLLYVSREHLNDYYRYLSWLRRTQAAELRGLRPRGEHVGDGIPRTLAGKPFEPLSGGEGVRRV